MESKEKYTVVVECFNPLLYDLVVGQFMKRIGHMQKMLNRDEVEFGSSFNQNGSIQSLKICTYGKEDKPAYKPMVIPFELNNPVLTDYSDDKVQTHIAIECHGMSDEDVYTKVASAIHEQFVGVQDYIDSSIVINFEKNIINIYFMGDSHCFPVVLFIREQDVVMQAGNKDKLNYVYNNQKEN